jgi:16S rRNA (guanine527-N7)-methyltransferase
LTVDVSRETCTRLRAYAAVLLRWNHTINLVAPGDERTLWSRHIEDCLQLVPLIPSGTRTAIDIGSGAGLPGLVLAIATGIPFHLVEADRRKAAFLREAARLTAAPVTIHCARAECAQIPPASLVTARGVAPLPRLLALAYPLLAPGGVCLFPKGQQADNELTAATAQWHMDLERIPSQTDNGAVIFRIRNLARVQAGVRR